MSETKYCYLVTVDTGEGLRVAHVDREASSVHNGDMVSIDTGEMGIVVAAIFTEEGGEDYSFIANLNPIYEATGIWRHAWTREEANEPS